MKKVVAAMLFGFVAGTILTWNYAGRDANADERSVRFARGVEAMSDSVITLELMERNGCEAVVEYHERQLEESVGETGKMVGEIAGIERLTPDLNEQVQKAKDWASEQELEEVVEATRRLVERLRK